MEKYIRIISVCAVCVLLASCSATRRLENRGPLAVTPDSMHLMVNQFTDPYTVNVNYTLEVPRGYVPRKAQVIHETWLTDGQTRQSVGKFYLNGKTFNRLMWRQAKFEGGVPDYSDGAVVVATRDPMALSMNTDVPFQIWMPNADLVATTSVEVCGAVYPLWQQTLTRGVEFIPLGPGPVIIEPEPVVVPEPVIKKLEGFASLSYAVNVYRVNPAYGNNAEELDKMTALLNKVLTDSMYTTTKIVVTGICSPDGSFAYNSDLARNRATAVKDYLVERLHVDRDLIEIESIPEDWEGLRELVESSDIANKAAILEIIDSTLSPDAKDAALKRLPQYSILKTKMYPQLRRVQYEIYYTEKSWM